MSEIASAEVLDVTCFARAFLESDSEPRKEVLRETDQ